MFKETVFKNLLKIIKESGIESEDLKGVIETFRMESKFIDSLLDTIPLFIVVLDMNGNVRRMSRYMLEAVGCSADEVNGKNYISKFVPEKDREKVRNAFQRMVNENAAIHQFNHISSKKGAEILVEWHGAPVFDSKGEVQFFFGAGIDISRKERSKAALRESEEKYRRLFEMVSDSILLIDDETGRILAVNPAASSMYGYSSEELLRMDNTQVSAEARETRKATLEHRSHIPVRYHRKKDGTMFPVEIMARHFNYMNREVHIAAIRDITFRMKAEEEKRLSDARIQRAQRMEAIGTLAGGIAHDFNNILGAMLGYTELAQMRLPEDSPVRADLNQVLNAGERAKSLINQIFQFSRGVEKEPKPLQVGLMIKETLKMLRSVLPSNIEIHQHIDALSGVIMADPTQIHQVLMNLFTNAAHAMEDRGGCLTVSLSEIDLPGKNSSKHHGLSAGAYLLLSVKDTGCGMNREVRERIFEPYFTTKDKNKGTGLGLAVVNGIVREYGGEIAVESEPGKGATFNIYLPKVLNESGEEIEERVEILPTGREKILFVDDEIALVEIGSRMLGDLGYDVVKRTSSIDALEIIRTEPDRFDLVITDQTMPYMTGKDLALELQKIRPGLPLVICTGFSEILTDKEAERLGICGIVKKPFSKTELAKIVRNVLEEIQRDHSEGLQCETSF